MDILMVASEMLPFAKTGGLADVVGALPLALADLGQKVSVVMPCYRGIEKKWDLENTGLEFTVPILEGDHWIDKHGQVLRASLLDQVDVFFIKMDDYYDREALYTLPEGDFPDNCARFTFLCRAVIELLHAKSWRPDVIHCHDWQSALIPVYLKTILREDELLSGTPLLFTIHNLGYQGLFWQWDMKLIGVPWEYFTADGLEYYGNLNLLKGGIVFADLITTVSQGYAREIQTPEYGLGLDGVLKSRAADLHGIVNGIDYEIWDPRNDQHLPAHFTPRDLTGKKTCKAALQKELGLPVNDKIPIVATISRLADQKGFDLIAAAIDEIMNQDLQFVLLGTGDKKYHQIFETVALRHAERAGVRIAFDEGLAHRIEAGADLFLMPSYYEPCGLNQMISLKYGTIPVVRATGGLDDTIDHWDPKTGKGNGFKFTDYTSEAMMKCLHEALETYAQPKAWGRLMQNAMKENHSWGASAKEYLALYRKVAP